GANHRIQTKVAYDLRGMDELEQITRHDMVAFVCSVQESIGEDAGRYVHAGLTSTDVVATGLSVQIQQACRILRGDVEKLAASMEKLARQHKYTPIMGRSHGMDAAPTSFGRNLALGIAKMR